MTGLASRRWLPEDLASALAALEAGEPVALAGVAAGALPFVAAILPAALDAPVAVVVPSLEDAEALGRDAELYLRHLAGSPEPPSILPPLEPEPYLGISPHLQAIVERSATFERIHRRSDELVVVPAEALLQLVPPPSVFEGLRRVVSLGDEIDRDRLVSDLLGAGYRRQDLVGSVGEMAVRGGIVDVYSPAAAEPYRLELRGETLESIRSFDPVSQRSERELEQAVLLPLVPFAPPADADERLRAFGARLPESCLDDLRAKREERRTRGSFAGIEYWAPVFLDALVSVAAYLRGHRLAVVEPEAVLAALEKGYAALEQAWREGAERGQAFPAPEAIALGPAEARGTLDAAPLWLEALDSTGGRRRSLRLHTQPARRYEGRIKELVQDLKADREAGLDAVVVVPTLGEAERVQAMLSEYEVPYLEGEQATRFWSQVPPAPGHGRVSTAIGRLYQGFRSVSLGLAIHAAPEVFGGGLPPSRRRQRRASAFASDFRDLKMGDLVVQVDHGIARFQGLKTVEVEGVSREFMVLAYAEEGRLYVPLDRLDLVQKYQGMEGASPRLDTLGGSSWARVKKKVKSELREMARELLELYARRRVARGTAFSPDGLFQKEFEDAFPYAETPDQANSICDVKADMESPGCMDRLLCGDVGYGKTEVAMRAAFKAVADGKQVAVLSPTTVLAFQHQRTFTERFKAFPVSVDMVSRFRTRKEIDEVLARVADGRLDILIGTHRLLSKDVRFKDLGLLIVDEEQRFGVSHKEKLKQLRHGIDVLTLSATPIPRTLQMSLAGLRDMSVIETPPKDRLAIETTVLRFQSKVIKEGVKRELERGGQVFFVHNRVESIYAMAETLHRIVPFARITVAHGQMRERELEDAMLRFVDRNADLLLATTIIENGLDLPNVNTIFINRAHRLGLAQLYQLRGRVGRSDRPAYAYLLVPPRAELSPTARRRLHAIQEFTELGSGFRVAALDLQIRGAGAVLGHRQHGHIAAIGFDLYMDLLDKTIRELKGEPEEEAPTQVALGIDLHVPESYIADSNQRLMVYKRIASLRTPGEIDDHAGELTDRFGEAPRAVRNLLDAARLRLEAQARRITAVERQGSVARLRFREDARLDPRAVVAFVKADPRRKLHPDRLEFPVTPGPDALDEIRLILGELG